MSLCDVGNGFSYRIHNTSLRDWKWGCLHDVGNEQAKGVLSYWGIYCGKLMVVGHWLSKSADGEQGWI